MINKIKGILISKKPTLICVDVNGISFELHITLNLYENLPSPQNEVNIISHLYVKDNPISFILYGFADESERECFRQIISVSGIGPKTTMSILSSIKYHDLIQHISAGEHQQLVSVPGVGKKTAERLAVELKDKFNKTFRDELFVSVAQTSEKQKISEIILALISLGYNRIEAEKMINKFLQKSEVKELSIEDSIREILNER